MHQSLLQTKVVLRTRQTELVNQIVTPKKKSNAKKGACNEASSSEEEDVGMRDSRRKGDFEHSNEELNGKSSDEEENQLPKCDRKGDAENLNEKKFKH